MRLVDAMRTKDTFTENAMPTHSTSLDACVDLFAGIGSARNWSPEQIENAFVKAWNQNPLVALRILFWARDVRGGAGERRVFRVCSTYMDSAGQYRDALYKNAHLIPEYGRWDDLFGLSYDEAVLQLIKRGLDEGNGLLAKWLPRKGPFANKVRKYLGLTPKGYRKLIVGLSNTVEQKMCAKEWNGIEYSHVPSVAMNKYRKAFFRNDEARFQNFIEAVNKGEATINAKDLFPYQLYQAYRRGENQGAVEAQWKNLPDYMSENEHRLLPMCDTSGSMLSSYGVNTNLVPMDISVSLGIYISERNEGPFKDAFLTFSGRPKLQVLKGSFYERCRQLERAEWGMNTNIEAAFALVLNTAVKHAVPTSEMPDTILVISDMQFDQCTQYPSDSALEMIGRRYAQAGYEMPQVVFWNVNARVGKMPVQVNDQGVGIVSGCSPAILTSILSGENITPVDLMMKTVNSERYQSVTI
jgi:hypothetical protein